MALDARGREIPVEIPVVNTADATRTKIIQTVDTALGATPNYAYDQKIAAGYDSGQGFDYGNTTYQVSDKVNGPAAAVSEYAPVTHIDPTTGVKTVSLQLIPKAELAAKAQAGNALAGIINKGDVNQVNTDAKQLAQGQLQGMLSANSPYLRDARNRAMRTANSRGLLNSAMAAGMGEEAAIGAAAPIAVQDAQTYGLNARQNASELNKALDTNAGLYGTQAQLDTQVNVNQQNNEQSVFNNYATNQTEALFKNQEAGNQANIVNAQLGTETVLHNADNKLEAEKFNAANQQSLLELGITLETDANKTTAGWNFQGMRDKFASMTEQEKTKFLTGAEMTKLYSAQNFELIKGATLTMLEEIGADNVAARKLLTDKFANELAIRLQNVVDKAAMDREVAGNATSVATAEISAASSRYGDDKQADTSKYNTDAQVKIDMNKVLAGLAANEIDAVSKIMMAPDTPSSVKRDTLDYRELQFVDQAELITDMYFDGDFTDLLKDTDTIKAEQAERRNPTKTYTNSPEDRVKMFADTAYLKKWYNDPSIKQELKDDAMSGSDPEFKAALEKALQS